MCSIDNYTDLQLNWFTHQGCIKLYLYNIQFDVISQESTCCLNYSFQTMYLYHKLIIQSVQFLCTNSFDIWQNRLNSILILIFISRVCHSTDSIIPIKIWTTQFIVATEALTLSREQSSTFSWQQLRHFRASCELWHLHPGTAAHSPDLEEISYY